MQDNPGALVDFTPVPRLKDRHNGWKPEVQRAFIEALADTGSVKAAARMVGRSEVGAYQLRRHPQGAEFAAAWEAALGHGIRRLEDSLMERALNGVAVPVYAWGEIVGTRTVYNDRLAMFMLRNRLPERYCEGGPRGLNAVGAMELERARKEWQAERDREDEEDEEGAADFVDQIAAMHRNWWAHLSPRTRAAYREFRRLEREDHGWPAPSDDPDAEIAAAEAEYRDVFAGDGRSKASLLGEVCSIGDDETEDGPET